MGQTGQVHDAHQLDQGKQHTQAMIGNGERHQAEHADGGIQHDNAGNLDHDLRAGVKKTEHGFTLLADHAQTETKEQGEEDDLEHLALGKGFHRIDGHDVHEHFD